MKKRNHHILKLISQGEHQQLDFKFEVSDSKKIARTLSAFANTDGGTLLIGVKDNGNIAGIRSEEEYYMIEAAAEVYCVPKVIFTAKEWELEGKTVLEVKIESSVLKPHTAPDKNNIPKAYIRVKDENILANEILVMAWKKKTCSKGIHVKISKPVERLLDYLNINPFISTNGFCRIAKINYNVAKKILSDLLAINTLQYLYENKTIVYRLVERIPLPEGKASLFEINRKKPLVV